MENWCSFYGHHELDFSSESYPTSYAIFGQIGKGKSSTVAALEWALFGKVMDSIDDGNDHILRKVRPIIDAKFFNGEELSFALPLLSDTSYRNGEYRLEVQIDFTHGGKKYQLSKTAFKNPACATSPKMDSDMHIHISLIIDGQMVENTVSANDFGLENEIQPIIEEIIPQDVSRFFFVKGDAIREFTGLIFGSDNNPKLQNDVNAVVGLPSLTRSIIDISRIKEQTRDKANSIASKNKGNSDLEKEISGENIKLKEIRDGYFDPDEGHAPGIISLRSNILELESEITNLEEELAELDMVKNLLAKREGHSEELHRKTSKLPQTAKLMKDSINISWKMLIQPLIFKKLNMLKLHAKAESELDDKISTIEQAMPHTRDRLEHADGSIPCPVCERNRDALSDGERDELSIQLKQQHDELSSLKYDLDGVKGSQSKVSKLMYFNTDLNPNSIVSLESAISIELEEIEQIKGYISSCNDALDNLGNIEGFEKLTRKLGELRNECVLVKNDLKFFESREELIQERLLLLRGRLSRSGGTVASELVEIENKIEAVTWFETIWNLSLSRFRESIRESINQVCTERFLQWVDDSHKYSHIETTEAWGLNVYGADKNWAPLANPGHRQLLSICFIEALRHCSKIEFPMIFDNPGAAVDQETIKGILNYYFKNPPGQFLALSHSGGMRESEIISQYQESGFLSKAWRISYEGGSGRHSKFEIL